MTKQIQHTDTCTFCGHWAESHAVIVSGVRCRVVVTGLSHGGVIGLPWTESCECRQFMVGEFVPPKTEDEITMDALAAHLAQKDGAS